MEHASKKTAKADLENKRLIFGQIGAILALAMVFLAFEYKSNELMNMGDIQRKIDQTIFETIPVTIQKPKTLPPPPPVAVKIETIDNESKEDQNVFIQAEPSPNEPIIIENPVMPAEEPIDEPLILVPEIAPEFPGGINALMNFIARNIRYPEMAREQMIQGRVYLSFIVEKDGSVSSIELLRGIGGGCDEEAIRVVNAMPSWQPGRQNGRAVRVAYNLPIRFSLK
ncbi:MAG: TonB family protein [Bacteroidetes bacterium]|nr:MAG: TonB family protein [Bacteroidota bacterium]